MPRHGLVCAACAVTLIASTIAVIVIIYSVVVPHLQQQAHIGSVCTVTDITLITDVTLTNEKQHDDTVEARRDNINSLNDDVNSSSNYQQRRGHDIQPRDDPITNTKAQDFTPTHETRANTVTDAATNSQMTRSVDNTHGCIECIPCVTVIVSYYDLDNVARTGHLRLKGEDAVHDSLSSHQVCIVHLYMLIIAMMRRYV